MKAMNQQQGFMNWFHAAAKAKVRTLLLYNIFMDTMKTVNEFGPNSTICDSQQPVAIAVSTGLFNTVLEVMLEHYCEYLELLAKGQKHHLPPTYKPDENGNHTDVQDKSLKIQSNGPITVDHGDFPDIKKIESFALYKGFTLFEIVNELVTKEEPHLARTIAEPKYKKKGTSDSKGNATMKYRFHFELISSFLEGIDSEDLRAVMDNLVSLARSEKFYIKSITEDKLEAVSTAAEYMLGKDDYKAAEEA
jgi:hypothetical protein